MHNTLSVSLFQWVALRGPLTIRNSCCLSLLLKNTVLVADPLVSQRNLTFPHSIRRHLSRIASKWAAVPFLVVDPDAFELKIICYDRFSWCIGQSRRMTFCLQIS